ncbi:hypothetical protein Ancab_021617 [Ancistrocladus abbreviatus]
MLQYDGELKLPSHYLVSAPEIERTSGEYLVHNGICTFACSETVKFGHVTFFWNGNCSGYFDPKMEEYVEIPSDIGISFNVKPKMKAFELLRRQRMLSLVANSTRYVLIFPMGIWWDILVTSRPPLLLAKLADEAVKVPIAIGDPGLATGVRFCKDLRNSGLANVAATVMNLNGFEASSDYEPTLIEVDG